MLWFDGLSRLVRFEGESLPGSHPKGDNSMQSSPMDGHTSALMTKHAGLEARLREEQARPAPDVTMIQQLKRQKLKIKEEISGV